MVEPPGHESDRREPPEGEPQGQARPGQEPQARQRPRRWFAWVWVVPIVAAGIVLWLAWRALIERGPDITISFKVADGLQPGQTRIQHRNVELGTVESLELTKDMSRVIVHARMRREAKDYLTDRARFAVIAPRVGFGGISGLSTLVSGSYIEMYPGQGGAPQRKFVGLDEPPALPPDTPGRFFVLEASDLGSLTRGSPISYRGLSVGEVEEYALTPDSQGVRVSAFVRAPYDRLVHPETRFWNAGGVDLTIGTQGIRFRADSWQQLLAGGIAFDTPESVLKNAPSTANASFRLYDNRRAAVRAPLGDELYYLAEFPGNQRGIGTGTAVELEGNEVGEVEEVHLRYDERAQTLVTRVVFSIDPKRVDILDLPRPKGADQQEIVRNWIQTLLGHGLQADVTSVSFLTGLKIVGLEMSKSGGSHVALERVGDYVKIPAGPSGDFTEVLQDLHEVLRNIDRATAGPELGHALKSLDDTLTRLDKVTQEAAPDIQSLLKSLRDTADSAQSTLNTVQSLIGSTAPAGTDLPRLVRELTEAARSVRGLADYLDRHPEALLRGRKGGTP
ncbi:MAG TPA: MlaD family protein [Steroidobacteraceae bacterium]|nr:MlaD family protein [Steroidobacteraceae bacterium]